MSAHNYFEPTRIMASDEVGLRREYASSIYDGMRFYEPTFHMTLVQLASIMITPLDSLSQIRRMSCVGSFMGNLAPLLKRYLIENPGIPKSYMTVNPKHSIPGDSDNQRNLCRKRDNYRCVFLPNTPNDVKVAHIVPPTWIDTQETMETIIKAMDDACFLTGFHDIDQYLTLFVDEYKRGTSDKCWNMISLDQTLYWYFKNRYMGLKCLGIEYTEDDAKATVIIQLTHIYRTTNYPMENATIEGDRNHYDDIVMGIQKFEHQCNLPYIEGQPCMPPTTISVLSGMCTRIEMSKDDAKKCKFMLDISWRLSMIAGISGAAAYQQYLPDHDSWSLIVRDLSIDAWVEDQARLYSKSQASDGMLESDWGCQHDGNDIERKRKVNLIN
ncbi:hypothetical protein HYE68_003001 [Fusarium pseudograminearum]|nr:hypothetical protein HYE68_003001 [Fusarium pseudograminearum]